MIAFYLFILVSSSCSPWSTLDKVKRADVVVLGEVVQANVKDIQRECSITHFKNMAPTCRNGSVLHTFEIKGVTHKVKLSYTIRPDRVSKGSIPFEEFVMEYDYICGRYEPFITFDLDYYIFALKNDKTPIGLTCGNWGWYPFPARIAHIEQLVDKDKWWGRFKTYVNEFFTGH